MTDRPIRASQLRVTVPTLEPDEAFVARLSSLAAAGAVAPAPVRTPRSTWRIGLAAASVAAVLIFVAWLTGATPTGAPEPAPAPASNPVKPTPAPRHDPDAVSHPGSPAARSNMSRSSAQGANAPTGKLIGPPSHAGHGHRGDGWFHDHANSHSSGSRSSDQGQHKGWTHGKGKGRGNFGNGPDENAGDHPNSNATDKSGTGNQPPSSGTHG